MSVCLSVTLAVLFAIATDRIRNGPLTVPLRPITTPGASVPQSPPHNPGAVSSHHPLYGDAPADVRVARRDAAQARRVGETGRPTVNTFGRRTRCAAQQRRHHCRRCRRQRLGWTTCDGGAIAQRHRVAVQRTGEHSGSRGGEHIVELGERWRVVRSRRHVAAASRRLGLQLRSRRARQLTR